MAVAKVDGESANVDEEEHDQSPLTLSGSRKGEHDEDCGGASRVKTGREGSRRSKGFHTQRKLQINEQLH